MPLRMTARQVQLQMVTENEEKRREEKRIVLLLLVPVVVGLLQVITMAFMDLYVKSKKAK